MADWHRAALSVCIALSAFGFPHAGVAQQPPPSLFEYQPAPAVDSAARMELHPNHMARLVGLPDLALHTLAQGQREWRLLLTCDLCLPDFLVRIQEKTGEPSSIEGMVFVLGGSLEFEQGNRSDEAYERAKAEFAMWRDSLTAEVGCGHWQPATDDYAWCQAADQPEEDWRQLLSRLRALGLAEVGSPDGYSPRPPTIELERAARQDTSMAYPDPSCTDIGGEGLMIEILDGTSFRQAHFWCLEAPRGEEHEAAAEARELLMSMIRRTTEL